MYPSPLPSPSSAASHRSRRRALRITSTATALGLALSMAPTITSGLDLGSAPASRSVSTPVTHLDLASLTGDPTRVSTVPRDAALVAKAAAAAGPAALATSAGRPGPAASSGWSGGSGAKDTVVEVPVKGGLVGLSWPTSSAPASDTVVAWRSQGEDGTWGEWTPTALSDAVDPAAARSGRSVRVSSEPLWVGQASRLQLRYPAGSPLARSARVEQIDPRTDVATVASTGLPAGSAQALAATPRIFTRAEWGADESLRGGSVPTIGRSVDGVVLHHDAGSNSYTAAQSAGIVRSIYAYHTQVQGWCDLGYNVIVDKYGQAFEGRSGGLNRPVQGAHALGFNQNTFGLSLLGNYSTASPTSAGLDIVARVLAWRLDAAWVPADGRTLWHGGYAGTRYPTVGDYDLPVVIGHRDVNYTECPGTSYYPAIASLRTRAAALQSFRTDPVYRAVVAQGGTARFGLVRESSTRFATGSTRTVMSGGARFFTTPSTGVRWMGPGLERTWTSLGGPSWGGFPTSDETGSTGGWFVELESNRTLTYSRTGVSTWTEGGIRSYWRNVTGGGNGALGMPVERMTATAGVWNQRYMGGTIYYDTATNRSLRTSGPIEQFYRSKDHLSGVMGKPTAEAAATSYGQLQRFSNGIARYGASTGRVTFTLNDGTVIR